MTLSSTAKENAFPSFRGYPQHPGARLLDYYFVSILNGLLASNPPYLLEECIDIAWDLAEKAAEQRPEVK